MYPPIGRIDATHADEHADESGAEGRRRGVDHDRPAAPGTTLLIPFDQEAARLYADIPPERGIRAPAAVQRACAAHARVDLFITNDERLSRYRVAGIQFVASLAGSFL
jgi:hypothetical protein